MIGSLRGEVLERDTDGIALVEVGGVGYEITVTERALAELEPGSQAFLYTHLHVREDHQQLFGFLTRLERVTFNTLLKANGVGPTMAMSILATHPPVALVDIVANADISALTLVPGVGKRTAEKLMVELKNRLSVPDLGDGGTGGNASSTAISDVREALLGLGFGDVEIRDTLRELDDNGDASGLLQDALKALGARRA